MAKRKFIHEKRKIIRELDLSDKLAKEYGWIPYEEPEKPEGKDPEEKAPEGKDPEDKTPEDKTPEANAPEEKAPEANAPEEKKVAPAVNGKTTATKKTSTRKKVD
jgi:hypothetical protein